MYCNKCGCECLVVEQIEHACMDCDVELPLEYPPHRSCNNCAYNYFPGEDCVNKKYTANSKGCENWKQKESFVYGQGSN